MRIFLKEHNPDNILAIIVFGLIIFGIAMVSSASLDTSYKIMEKTGQQNYYMWKQIFSAFVAMITWILVQSIHYTFWKKISIYMLFFSIIGLILVLIPGISADYGTSRSWIYIPFLGSFQPVEFSKLALIIYLASWFESKKENVKSFINGTVPFVLILLSHIILLALQPDFGSIELIVIISTMMFFVAGANIWHLISLGTIGGMILFYAAQTFNYIQKRFLSFLDMSIDPEGIGYHIKQALIAIGSGGFWGLGFGYSRQKFNYLPEAQGDSIFAVMAEELGFLKVVIIIILYLYLFYRGIMIAKKSQDLFARYTAFGISVWIITQAFINMAVNMSLAPITGITLPFLSYGGSSLMMTVWGVAILLNISKYTSDTIEEDNEPFLKFKILNNRKYSKYA